MNAPFRSYTGVERAAVLMMLVGEEEAAAILQKLDPEEVRQLGKAMFAVADVGEDHVGDVLDDFVGRARERTAIGFDPKPIIEGVMTRALGQEKADSVLARITPPEAACQIDLLDWMDAGEIAAMIEKEHPQIAAVVIANLDPVIAGQVLEMLPDAVQPDILHRVARLGPITPEAVETLRTMLAGRTSAVDPVGRASRWAARARRPRSCRARARPPNSASCPSCSRSTAKSRKRSRKRCSCSRICSTWTTRTSAR